MSVAPVLGIAEARAELPALVRRLRDDPGAEPVAIGSHRKPAAYLVSAARLGEHGSEQGTVLLDLRRKSRVIRSLAAAHGIERVRIFGSVARGDERPDSDIDLLVTTAPDTSTFDLAAFALDVEALTGRTVDILSDQVLRPGRHDQILRDTVTL